MIAKLLAAPKPIFLSKAIKTDEPIVGIDIDSVGYDEWIKFRDSLGDVVPMPKGRIETITSSGAPKVCLVDDVTEPWFEFVDSSGQVIETSEPVTKIEIYNFGNPLFWGELCKKLLCHHSRWLGLLLLCLL